MPKLPRVPSLLIIRALKRARFYEYHITGSHMQLRHALKPNLHVTVPFHRKELALKTIKSIIKQSGLTIDEFINFL